MPYNNTKKNYISIIVLPVLLIFTFSSAALAKKPAKNLVGVWAGVVTDKSADEIDTDLTINAVSDENSLHQYSLHYGSPRNCRLEAVKIFTDSTVIKLKFNESSGGFCDKFYNGKMTIEKKDDNYLNILVEKKSSGFKETAILIKTSRK